MAAKFEVKNPEAITAALARLDAACSESTLRRAAATGATVLKEEVMLRVPEDTGELRAGVTVAYKGEDSMAGHIATYMVTFVGEYPQQPNGDRGMRKRDVAGWLEYGTSKMAARPFIRPAYTAKRRAAAEAAQARILEELKKA